MTYRRLVDALALLRHAASLGAAGAQAALAPGQAPAVRAFCEQHGMYFEAMAALPREEDSSAFESALREAAAAGARCVRVVCLSGRRYESFRSLEEWRAFTAQSRRRLALAVPLAARARLPLALENHKDWTQDELLALLSAYESEFLGVCLDTGNNLALLDGASEFVEALAPYAVSTHLKDMALEDGPGGFLLAEVPLGEGLLDIPALAARLRAARPSTPLTLEMITRDPLRVPCLGSAYWATFPERPAAKLAALLALARSAGRTLPRPSSLPPAAQLDAEEENVKACLAFARRRLA
jgi:sugar phosphate isomerase/epimerase